MRVVFWTAAVLVVYTYLGYPMVLAILRRFITRPISRARIEPKVTLLIPAYNEAQVIARKIHNSLELEYPKHKLDIVVASDGSTDQTVAVAEQFARDSNIRVLAYPRNRGKMATLNASMGETSAEIIVFSDAPALLNSDALRRLIDNFADPSVGAVSGRYTVVKASEVNTGASEDLYWNYETYLKICESDLGSTLGAHGHLYAIRRELYPFPDSAVINDDYVIPSSVVAKGYRAIYEPRAVVREEAREMSGFGRRVRIVAGNIQQLSQLRSLVWPLCLMPLFFFISHKALRLLAPLAMLAAFFSSLALAGSPAYGVALALQSIFYFLAFCGALWRLKPAILMLPYYFSMINSAVFPGFYHAATHRRGMAWE